MSFRLECIKSESVQPTATVHRTIESLPQELLDQVFFHLNEIDLQNLSLVNRSFNISVISAANCHEPERIKAFIQSLIQKLNEEVFPEQREELQDIEQEIIPQKFSNLLIVKTYILGIKAQLIEILKTVGDGMLNHLEMHVQPPHFMSDIFHSVEIERQIDSANLIPVTFMRGFILKDISTSLFSAGYIERAIEVALSIPVEHMRWSGLFSIFEALIKAGNIDRAIAILASINDEEIKWKLHRFTSQALARAALIDKAIEVATSIPDEESRGYAISEIFGFLSHIKMEILKS